MCLIVPKGLKPHITTEDKIVFKLLTEYESWDGLVLKSPFQSEFGWELNKLYTDSIEFGNEYCSFCDVDGDMIAELFPTWRSGIGVDSVESGFHYVTDFETYQYEGRYGDSFYKCLIPAGSEVIESWGLGVTNQIKILEKIW